MEITWREPTQADRQDMEGEVPLLLVAELGKQPVGVDSFPEVDEYGDVYVTIDKDWTLVFTYNGGGPAPWDEWTVVFYNESLFSVEQAKTLAQRMVDLFSDNLKQDTWIRQGFVMEIV